MADHPPAPNVDAAAPPQAPNADAAAPPPPGPAADAERARVDWNDKLHGAFRAAAALDSHGWDIPTARAVHGDLPAEFRDDDEEDDDGRVH